MYLFAQKHLSRQNIWSYTLFNMFVMNCYIDLIWIGMLLCRNIIFLFCECLVLCVNGYQVVRFLQHTQELQSRLCILLLCVFQKIYEYAVSVVKLPTCVWNFNGLCPDSLWHGNEFLYTESGLGNTTIIACVSVLVCVNIKTAFKWIVFQTQQEHKYFNRWEYFFPLIAMVLNFVSVNGV